MKMKNHCWLHSLGLTLFPLIKMLALGEHCIFAFLLTKTFVASLFPSSY